MFVFIDVFPLSVSLYQYLYIPCDPTSPVVSALRDNVTIPYQSDITVVIAPNSMLYVSLVITGEQIMSFY